MSYMHINQLYKDQEILLFRECYALEKIHGTSSHISYDGTTQQIRLFPGGVSYDAFSHLFNPNVLMASFIEFFGNDKVTVYGEAYGGSCQKMSATYGSNLRFVVFEVRINESWLAVPAAESVAHKLGLEFVHYVKIPTTLEAIDAQRDADSVQAVRNGCGPGHIREGVVLRPLIEVTKNNGARVICKHKRPEFSEQAHEPKVVDPARMQVLQDAQAIADNWVTPMRLEHVLDKLPEATGMEHTRLVISAMVEDVKREAAGEIVESKEVWTAVSKKAVALWKNKIESRLQAVA